MNKLTFYIGSLFLSVALIISGCSSVPSSYEEASPEARQQESSTSTQERAIKTEPLLKRKEESDDMGRLD